MNPRKLNISKSNPKKFIFGSIPTGQDRSLPIGYNNQSELGLTVKEDKISSEPENVFCVYKVGVGRTYCHPHMPDLETEDQIVLPDEYDSVFFEKPRPVESPNDSSSRLGKSDAMTTSEKFLEMSYKVFSHENAILTHIIRTKISIKENSQVDEGWCSGKCGDHSACYCNDCDKEYYETCWSEIHELEEHINDQTPNP